jgi:pyruvate/2-oxoglutarate/acetoin dehydrogenase E1 component
MKLTMVVVTLDRKIKENINHNANLAAKMRYMSGGQLSVSVITRTLIAHGRCHGGDRFQVPITWFKAVLEPKMVAPSTPYDAGMLLKASLRDDNPVLLFESCILCRLRGKFLG